MRSLIRRTATLARAALAASLGIVLASPVIPCVRAQLPPTWERGPQVQYPAIASRGTDGIVFASAVWDPDGSGYQKPRLIIGGNFNRAGNALTCNNVAMWDGSNWFPVGIGLNGTVNALFVFNGELYAGGSFTASGSNSCLRIAKYNPPTNAWVGVAGGFNNEVKVLASQDGFLIAAGRFGASGNGSTALSNVARLFNGSWQNLPGGGVNGTVYAMRSIGTRLFVGGTFTTAGSVAVRNLASWNFSLGWENANGGVDGPVNAIGESSGRAVVGGSFARVKGTDIVSPKLGIYVPGSPGIWISAINFPGADVYSILGEEVSPTSIYVGTITPASGSILWNYNGTTWTRVANGVRPSLDVIATMTRHEGQPVFAGLFNFTQGALTQNNVARLNQFSPSLLDPIAPRWNGSIAQFTNFDGTLVAGGDFEQSLAGYEAISGVVGWAGGPNFGSYGVVRGSVSAVRSIGNGVTLSSLYVGGVFPSAGFATNCNNVAAWSGLIGPGGVDANWSALGSGFTNSTPGFNAPVFALGAFGGTPLRPATVHAGGFFTNSGTNSTLGAARLSSGAWQGLGTGLTSTNPSRWVNQFANFGGGLVAGGVFDGAGGLTANSIASWNGTAWSTLGTGLRSGAGKGTASALAVFNGGLVVAGRFDNAGGVTVNNVASWNGTTWANMSAGITRPTEEGSALAVYGGELYLATSFIPGGATTEGRVYRWTGSAWSQVGGTADNFIYALFPYRNRLHVGGAFKRVDGNQIETHSWAIINKYCVADMDDGGGFGNADGGVGIEDLLYFIQKYEQGSSIADVDNGFGSGIPDGGVSVDDLLYYLGRYDAGC